MEGTSTGGAASEKNLKSPIAYHIKLFYHACMRQNTDLRLHSIRICNPKNLSDEDLLGMMTQIHRIPPEELIRPEGKPVSDFLRRINEEIAMRCALARKNNTIRIIRS